MYPDFSLSFTRKPLLAQKPVWRHPWQSALSLKKNWKGTAVVGTPRYTTLRLKRYYHYWERRIFNAITTMLLRGGTTAIQVDMQLGVLAVWYTLDLSEWIKVWVHSRLSSVLVSAKGLNKSLCRLMSFMIRATFHWRSVVLIWFRPPLLRVKVDCSGAEIDDQALQSVSNLLSEFVDGVTLADSYWNSPRFWGLQVDQQAPEEHDPICQIVCSMDGSRLKLLKKQRRIWLLVG